MRRSSRVLRVALIVLGLVAAGCTSAGSHGAQQPATPTPSPSSSTRAEELQPRSEALAESHDLLQGVRVPPGGSIEPTAPVPTLHQPPERPASPDLLDLVRWWSVGMSPSETLAWLEAHPPAGLQRVGEGSFIRPAGPGTYLRYSAPTTATYNLATLLIAVVPDGSGSAIRADGQTTWIPLRPPSEVVPTDVSKVVLTAQRERGATKAAAVVARRTLTGARAAELVRLANELPRDNLGPHTCPAETGLSLIQALFVAPERTSTFAVDPVCGSVQVEQASEPALLDTPAFRRALTTDLGLPIRWP